MHKALFQQEQDGGIRCGLCQHHCLVQPEKRGICGVRENKDGVLVTLVYDKIIARHVDPIEKKPFFHVLPGSMAYSLATPGCNFRCKHCQNADISQLPHDRGILVGEAVTPAELVRAAIGARCKSIAYTYTEPTVFYELAIDTARHAAESGLKNLFVTNGYTSAEALRQIAPYLHAANIDLKAYTESFYRDVCGARLQPVLDTIRLYKELGIWVEITTLIIPGLNDSDDELDGIARFVVSLGENTPWHVSQFHPTYRLTSAPRTPVSTLRRARAIGVNAGLRYVYEGNVPGEGEDTFCGNCRETVIERSGYQVEALNIEDGRCVFCGATIDGIWK